jgi:hypothetical protein
MYDLTKIVRRGLITEHANLFGQICDELPEECHVEHVLSHLVDLIALAERSKHRKAQAGGTELSLDDLRSAYTAIIMEIAKTVRYGYRPAADGQPEKIGTAQEPIVEIGLHREFVRQLFKSRTNLEGRSRVGFITTNYDTLLEDALALERRIPIDGFSGGSVAFWSGFDFEVNHGTVNMHRILKLHGSVDWFNDRELGLLRVRYGVQYLSDLANTLIYPQATKYMETQKDPFAKVFDCFRKSLMVDESHILGIIGYSFGDEHINAEIEQALRDRKNKTTLIAFCSEKATGIGNEETAPIRKLENWRHDPTFGSRVYIATDKALYCGDTRITADHQPLTWCRFAGLTEFLSQGANA